jgi:hypothetical protein
MGYWAPPLCARVRIPRCKHALVETQATTNIWPHTLLCNTLQNQDSNLGTHFLGINDHCGMRQDSHLDRTEEMVPKEGYEVSHVSTNYGCRHFGDLYGSCRYFDYSRECSSFTTLNWGSPSNNFPFIWLSRR